MYDCIVIGGGPAGLAAATYLGRFMRSSLVIDAGGGRASSIPTTHNLLGFPEGISGQVLLARMHQHATRYGAKVVNDFVKGVVQTQSGFVVTTAIDEVRTRTEPPRLFRRLLSVRRSHDERYKKQVFA